MAQLIKNTTKEYKCINCGHDEVNVVRNSPDPRLKCLRCNFTFDGSQAKQAEEAGAIPLENPDNYPDADVSIAESPSLFKKEKEVKEPISKLPSPKNKIPRFPSFVFLSKDRKEVQFCTTKDLIKTTLYWEAREKKFDLYELSGRKAEVKVDIGENK